MSEDCVSNSFDEFSETASQICCNGSSFKEKIQSKGCQLPVDYLYSPIITIDNENTWTKDKNVSIEFRPSKNAKYYIKSSINVESNSIASTCGIDEPTGVCVGENTKTLIANNWYQVNEGVNLKYEYNGLIEAKVFNGIESKNKNKNVSKIDNVVPSIISFSGLSISNSDVGYYNTTELRLTITAKDSESKIDKIEFYKNSISSTNLMATRNNDETDENKETFTTSISISNPVQNDSYIAVVYDKSGNIINKTLDNACTSKTSDCNNGYKITDYTCNSGYTYSTKTSCSSTGTTTRTTCGTIYCPSGMHQSGCTCVSDGSSNTTTTSYSGGGNTTTTKCQCSNVYASCIAAHGTGQVSSDLSEACARSQKSCEESSPTGC